MKNGLRKSFRGITEGSGEDSSRLGSHERVVSWRRKILVTPNVEKKLEKCFHWIWQWGGLYVLVKRNFSGLSESGASVRSELEPRHRNQWVGYSLPQSRTGKGKKNRVVIRGNSKRLQLWKSMLALTDSCMIYWSLKDSFFYLMGNNAWGKIQQMYPLLSHLDNILIINLKTLISGDGSKDLGRQVQDIIYLFRMVICFASMNVLQILKIHIGFFT